MVGDVIDLTVTFAENTTVDTADGTPQIGITIGATPKLAGYTSGSGTTSLVFRYTVAEGDLDTDGVSTGSGNVAGHKVDGVRPLMLRAAVDGDALTLTYSEALRESPAPLASAYTVAGGECGAHRLQRRGNRERCGDDPQPAGPSRRDGSHGVVHGAKFGPDPGLGRQRRDGTQRPFGTERHAGHHGPDSDRGGARLKPGRGRDLRGGRDHRGDGDVRRAGEGHGHAAVAAEGGQPRPNGALSARDGQGAAFRLHGSEGRRRHRRSEHCGGPAFAEWGHYQGRRGQCGGAGTSTAASPTLAKGGRHDVPAYTANTGAVTGTSVSSYSYGWRRRWRLRACARRSQLR